MIVRVVYARNGPSGSSRPEKASITFPAEVAWAIDGRPSLETGWIWCEPGTKSTVIASSSPGTERGRLAGRVDERDEVGARDLAHVESREHRVREVDEPDAEAVAAGRVDALDESRGGERSELARYGARRHAGAPRDLVRAELAAVCKVSSIVIARSAAPIRRVGRLTSARHRCRFVAEFGTALLIVQFRP